ncbi:MAG: IS1634 family transposase [Chloroflexota bacterium]
MYIRKCRRKVDGKNKDYWQLVESYRTERGPRQRVVAHLGDMDEPERLGIKEVASGNDDHVHQASLFEESKPRWTQVDTSRVKVERTKSFGGVWLCMQVIEKLGLVEYLSGVMTQGREEIPWSLMSLVLVLLRLCEPSSELRVAEHLYERTALGDILGVPIEKVNDDRLYRALDALLPHKAGLEQHLKERLGELFEIEYDLLLYDVTSTYFEGQCESNDQAKRGYSRDHRGDCKQVCIALVVSKCGMPFAYEIFDGNRHDSTTVEEIVVSIQSKYGSADRIWVMDRGMTSEDNIEFLKENNQRYILGTPKASLKQFESQLLEENWDTVHDGLEVKLCPCPEGNETFILCRSAQRREKEKAMHERFEKRIEEGLVKIVASCTKKHQNPILIARRVGKLLGANTRAAALFSVDVKDVDGHAKVVWSKVDAWRDWASLSEGSYMLRSNIMDWTAEELWKAYIQLTQAEAAFRIHKSDLSIRPIWHQKKERVQAHILVCFLAFVLWKTLGQMCHAAGLGDEPRKVLDEISQIQMVDVVLPTKSGVNIRRRCVAQPTKHQAILLAKLGLVLPKYLDIYKM